MTPTMRLPALFVSLVLAGSFALGQTAPTTPDSPTTPPVQQAPASTPDAQSSSPLPAAPVQAGGAIHGTVKDGNIPLPGVSVTASNSLTGKKYSTTTDITGSYSLVIPQNGRYVLKTELSAFAPVTKEALLNATAHDQAVDFSVILASRAAEQEQQTSLASAARQLAGGGAQSLNLLGAASDLIQAGAGGEDAGAALPSLASNSDFASSDSVAVTGQTGTTNPF
ncbi:MAG: carboxypeptidase-like regulatory domain-containing protein, partial [Acidobacteriaceae bacterium]